MCLYTGRHCFRHGVYRPEQDGQILPYTETTIAHVLHDASYANGLFGKWHLGAEPDPNQTACDKNYPTHHPVDPWFGWDKFVGAMG